MSAAGTHADKPHANRTKIKTRGRAERPRVFYGVFTVIMLFYGVSAFLRHQPTNSVPDMVEMPFMNMAVLMLPESLSCPMQVIVNPDLF